MTIRNALLLAGVMILLSIALAIAEHAGLIGEGVSQRSLQVAIGLLVAYFANLAPKALQPLSERCAPATAQALQRLSGWTLVLGGLGYSLAWLVLPIAQAGIWSMAILGSGLLLVAARCGWARQAARRAGR